MPAIISVKNVSKTYARGFEALRNVSLDIEKGEIFALLGPNGAGKTTLINIICGIVTPSAGRITADGFDIIRDFRQARARIGLVPQELATDSDKAATHLPLVGHRIFAARLELVRRDQRDDVAGRHGLIEPSRDIAA